MKVQNANGIIQVWVPPCHRVVICHDDMARPFGLRCRVRETRSLGIPQ